MSEDEVEADDEDQLQISVLDTKRPPLQTAGDWMTHSLS